MACPAVAAANPEYVCERCGGWHSGACPEAALRQLGDLVARTVREADARIPASPCAPRTVAEMRVRLIAASGEQACGSCGGAGGRVEDTSDGGTIRQTWRTCGTCGGSGVS
ncbi:hypothetical protein [Streptomyces sp. NPDC058739]|uniref:hypothetical protein n=1 Tax=Streptomyces sp. NPDC058739 TaxID=3346618 RepID=UPI00368651E9